jgi:tetratricopeptide (TPR) repeat protein
VPLALLLGAALALPARAADLADAQKLFDTGKYAEAIDSVNKALQAGDGDDDWWALKIRAELTLGRYPEAFKTFATAIDRYDASVDLRMLGYEVYLANDRPADAAAILATVKMLGEMAPWRYDTARDRVALGRAHVKSGTDARQVLETYYDRAKRASPQSALPYLASGDLALQKQDFALAAENYREATRRAPEDPDGYLGLARAFTDDAEQATAALKKALELNPNHVESLLLQADNLLDREEYAQAETALKKALDVNPKHPRAWAYRSVMAHLTGDKKNEAEYRTQALSSWKTNPEVDWLIGHKLSHQYRFAEGAAAQRRALAFAPGYLPAKMRLCEDLLRLGQETDGWKLADEVFKEDPYSVLAYNLITLHDVIEKFTAVENEHFLVRMDPKEAQIYGQRALRLLTEAREKLSAKYGVSLPDKTIIEIFPAQKDFAIRTFGLPGGEGFLGVCFGPVVTVNSPASRGANTSNWEAILWHEFCHSITLFKTNNKMPRWLSEGISVYEELQANPAWGQRMTPEYREMVLKGEATPVSKLSSAFMRPPSPQHLMFAYYESSQVIEYIIKNFGIEALRKVLADLGSDVNINEALSRHTVPIEKLDADFAAYLKGQAENLAKVDWAKPDFGPEADSAAIAAWNKAHPNNLAGILAEGRAMLAEKKFKEAKGPLEKIIELYPAFIEGGGPYMMLAQVHRELGESKEERAVLEKFASLDADSVEPRLRLMGLAVADKDWKLVKRVAEQLLAINPLIPAPHRFLVQASVALNDRPTAIEGHRTLLLLDPLDRAEHHYQLGKLLYEEKNLPEARREVVKALEDAPRYRAAHALLLQIAAVMPELPPPPSPGAAELEAPTTTQPAVTPPPAAPRLVPAPARGRGTRTVPATPATPPPIRSQEAGR